MASIVFRPLTQRNLARIRDIDRSEHIEGFYILVDGRLIPDDRVVEARAWHDTDHTEYIERTQAVLNRFGYAFGAWSGERLVGFAVLDTSGVGSNPGCLQLNLFFVSAGFRGNGIARRLLQQVTEAARAHGATEIYISATPSRNTVDAYLHMGARLLSSPDPELFAREPEDIHLVLPLDGCNVVD